MTWNFLNSWATGSFSRRILLHCVRYCLSRCRRISIPKVVKFRTALTSGVLCSLIFVVPELRQYEMTELAVNISAEVRARINSLSLCSCPFGFKAFFTLQRKRRTPYGPVHICLSHYHNNDFVSHCYSSRGSHCCIDDFRRCTFIRFVAVLTSSAVMWLKILWNFNDT